jgi:hypothetical protein
MIIYNTKVEFIDTPKKDIIIKADIGRDDIQFIDQDDLTLPLVPINTAMKIGDFGINGKSIIDWLLDKPEEFKKQFLSQYLYQMAYEEMNK